LKQKISAKYCHCGKLELYHTFQEARLCKEKNAERKQKRHGKYFQRLELAGKIIREREEISKLELTREINKQIETSPWTIEKMKNYILETFPDIQYNKTLRVFYVYTTLDKYIQN